MRNNNIVFLTLAASILASGCSMMAPQYSASLENVQKLKDAGTFTAKVGTFESSGDAGNANPISIRGSSMNSPYQGSYAVYLAESIKQELSLAGKLAPDAKLEISGMLMKNDINADIGTGHGNIEARFVVKKDGKVAYDQVKTANTEWESSFVGAIAIPKAQQEYPSLVKKLLVALYADDAFLKALK